MDVVFVELQMAVVILAVRNTVVLDVDFNGQVGAEDPQQLACSPGIFALKRDTLRTSGMVMHLLDPCVANNLVLINTFFDHKDKCPATWWTGLGDRNADQIDFYCHAQKASMGNDQL